MTRQLDDAFLDELAAYGPIGKTLGMVIRPAFVAPQGKTFVWGDWSAIEARVLPWLANSPGAEKVLDIFRTNDLDPSLPDIYKITAGELLHKDPRDVTKNERQSHGKVPVLSLGFGGGVGALQKMAVNYGVYFDEDASKALVTSWRDRNPWAREFWGQFRTDPSGEVTHAAGLWGACLMAIRNPGTIHEAGRVAYAYDPDYMGGTLFCALPCGRLLTYPDCRMRTRKVKNKDTGEETEVTALWYRKGFGWSALWYGKLCLAGDTLVLTPRGWVPLLDVRPWDLVWDGEEWVAHDGLTFQGCKSTVPVEGVSMTSDHEVLTDDGWVEASQLAGHDRAAVRLPDGAAPWAEAWAQQERPVVGAVRLRGREAGVERRLDAREPEAVTAVMRLPDSREDRCGAAHARHDEAPGLRGVALDARPLSAADASGMEELRGAGHHGVRALAVVRELLGRHGADLRARPDAGADREQQGLLAGQLQMGDAAGAGAQPPQQPEEPVFDLVNAGPRHRFTVLGANGPMLVHNCENVTQAVAGSIIRETLVYLDTTEDWASWMPVVGHTHDEIVAETDEAAECVTRARKVLGDAMLRKAAWRETLPLAVEVEDNWWYTKSVPHH